MGSGFASPHVAFIDGLSTARQQSYDRLIIKFTDGLPNGNIELRTQSGTKFTSSAGGRELTLAGSNGILIVLHDADLHTSYRGPTDIVTGYPILKEVRAVQDSDGTVELGLGINGQACYRPLFINNPSVLVVDLKG